MPLAVLSLFNKVQWMRGHCSALAVISDSSQTFLNWGRHRIVMRSTPAAVEQLDVLPGRSQNVHRCFTVNILNTLQQRTFEMHEINTEALQLTLVILFFRPAAWVWVFVLLKT